MKDKNQPRSIYEYMAEVGVEIPQLVDASLELLAGIERTKELEIALEKQIRTSLEDINVIVLIVAGIRVEEDLQNHQIEGVDVDDDPAYLYSDEVLGMAIANQIAGTKAIFNFKRYDEEKPGIIGTLGPMLDDVFAGLVAGCMSKLFEE
jgi:alpha-ribazole phosphatase CobZ